ncbi:MAG TPA: hypothetical protein VGQ12_17710 [Candidatus Angelobacter sp.]|jgi:hypothetical protein|nr:hypothetical protein [Candidatus Angelobacter sp.]
MARREVLPFSFEEHANIAIFAACFFRANGHPHHGGFFSQG